MVINVTLSVMERLPSAALASSVAAEDFMQMAKHGRL